MGKGLHGDMIPRGRDYTGKGRYRRKNHKGRE